MDRTAEAYPKLNKLPISGSDHMFVAERQALRPAGLQQLYWMGDAL
jgi:hypothetical protein